MLSKMSQIIADMCQVRLDIAFDSIITSLTPQLSEQEMKDKFHTMLNNPHASPPIRLLFILISKNKAMPDAANSERLIRSNRSTKFRSNQGGKMKSIFGENSKVDGEVKTKGRRDSSREVPAEFEQLRIQIRKVLQERISGTEWRALGVDPVGGPMTQVSWGCSREGALQYITSDLLFRFTDPARD